MVCNGAVSYDVSFEPVAVPKQKHLAFSPPDNAGNADLP